MNPKFCLLFAGALVGCNSPLGKPIGSRNDYTSTTICRIMLRKHDYVGKPVRLEARINTDQRHFAFLEDEKCGKMNILDIGRARGNADYEKLRTGWAAVCDQRGSPGLCVIEEAVDVIGTIRKADEGHLVIDISSIRKAPSS